MKSDEKLWKICIEIYRALYEDAIPSADFDQVWEAYGAEPFYQNYYLDNTKQEKIINDICKKYRLTKQETSRVQTTVLLGASPIGHKKD